MVEKIYLCRQYNTKKVSIMSSFIADKVVMDGVTFDDVLLIPNYSEVLPYQVNLQTKFSRNITLNIPIVSAALLVVLDNEIALFGSR